MERLKDKKKLYFKDEEKLFEKLQVPYVPAVCRVDGKAVGRSFDNIIFSSDIVGQLHNHTTFSDGKYSPEEFASLSLSQDVEFIAISDHSPATGGVGVKKEKLKQYVEAIRSTRRKFADKGLTVYTSMEVELSKSGMLDKNINRPMYKEFDFVFLSAHRGTAGVDITERLVTAIEYCYRHDIRAIIAHPSNRLLVSYAGSGKVLAREGSVPDWERIFELCAKTNTLLEINAQPTRMDLDVSLVVQAKKAGCRFVINADSHDGLFLNTEYGVWIAQAAWLTTKSVVNSNHSQFISWLK